MSSIVVSSDRGVSVLLGEIAILMWNNERTSCNFWLKGNSQSFRYFDPRSYDEVLVGRSTPDGAVEMVKRSSLEILREHFP